MTPEELRQQRLDKREAIIVARINANEAAYAIAVNRMIEELEKSEVPEGWELCD